MFHQGCVADHGSARYTASTEYFCVQHSTPLNFLRRLGLHPPDLTRVRQLRSGIELACIGAVAPFRGSRDVSINYKVGDIETPKLCLKLCTQWITSVVEPEKTGLYFTGWCIAINPDGSVFLAEQSNFTCHHSKTDWPHTHEAKVASH